MAQDAYIQAKVMAYSSFSFFLISLPHLPII